MFLSGGTAGGQTVVVSGTGFDDSASVTICGQACVQVGSTSSTYTCKTPANTGLYYHNVMIVLLLVFEYTFFKIEFNHYYTLL